MACLICFDSFGDGVEAFVIGCPSAHQFCRSCLAQHAASRRFPRCPGEGCGYELHESEVKDLCGENSESLNNLRMDTLNRAIDGLGHIVHCPNPECTNAVAIESRDARQRIECECGWPAWCTCCKQPYHYHLQCGDVQPRRQRWLEWVSRGRAVYHEDSFLHERGARQRVALADATARHAELQQDEAWKAANCRECPSCGRCVQKLIGCSMMVCGQDAHGGNRQSGCGHRFLWTFARTYQAVQESRQLPQLDPVEVKLKGVGLRHAFCKCSVCDEEIVGPRFRCIHCHDFNLCVACDRKPEGVGHINDHVFDILFKPDYDLNSFATIGSAITIVDQSDHHGWEAVISEQISDDIFRVRLASDGSMKVVHRSGFHVRLANGEELAQHVESQLRAEEDIKRARASEMQQKRLERAKAVTAMKEEVCILQ